MGIYPYQFKGLPWDIHLYTLPYRILTLYRRLHTPHPLYVSDRLTRRSPFTQLFCLLAALFTRCSVYPVYFRLNLLYIYRASMLSTGY